MNRQDLPLSGLTPASQALSGNDLILLTQNTPDGLQSVNATLARLLQYLFVDSGAIDDYIGQTFLKQVYTLNPNSGLIGDGRSSNPMSVDFSYLDTLYVNETDFTNYQNNVNTRQINAGAGLIGGGNLSADRTISMGVPSSITSGSSNSASGDTHSHELAAGAVTNTKLADGAVTDSKIVSMSANKLTGIIPSENLPSTSGSASINVIDNLTSNSVNEALSANQGRVLARQIKNLSDTQLFNVTDFDFMVIKYKWTTFSGEVLITETKMNYYTPGGSSLVKRELVDDNNNEYRMGILHTNVLKYDDVVLAKWTADTFQNHNTVTNYPGEESILIYFNRLRDSMNGAKLFDFIFNANWQEDAERGDGFIIMQIETFKGGNDMQQINYDFVPLEGTEKISSQAFYVSTPLVSRNYHSGYSFEYGYELARLQLDLDRNLLLFRLSEQDLIKTSLAQNGYTTLPNGLIMQWGRGQITNDGDVVFPMAFPNSLVNVQVTNEGAGSISHGYNWSLSDTTKFRCTSHGGGALSYSYIALGY